MARILAIALLCYLLFRPAPPTPTTSVSELDALVESRVAELCAAWRQEMEHTYA